MLTTWLLKIHPLLATFQYVKYKTHRRNDKTLKIGEVVAKRATYHRDPPEYFIYQGGKRAIKLRTLTVDDSRALVIGKQVDVPLSELSDYTKILGLIVGPDSQFVTADRSWFSSRFISAIPLSISSLQLNLSFPKNCEYWSFIRSERCLECQSSWSRDLERVL